MRLGIKLESRADVRRLVDILEQRMGTAGRDLQVRMHACMHVRAGGGLQVCMLACEGGELQVGMHAEDGWRPQRK